MRVDPDVAEGQACWAVEDGAVLGLAVWTEKRIGRGEDAPPVWLYHRPTGHGTIAVFDGVGGAGAGVTAIDRSERMVTGARLAANVAHLAWADWFGRRERDRSDESAHDALVRRIGAARTPQRMKVSGTLIRELPTTVAAISFAPYDEVSLRAEIQWAGDSRAYALSPDGGLHQLSTDDTDEPDALAGARIDPPMTNYVWAGPFTLNKRSMKLPLDSVLLCATDGFFGYVDTPAHFEYRLLDHLCNARSMGEWAAAVADDVRSYTGDDATLSLFAVGFRGFADLQRAFKNRRDVLDREHWRPFTRLAEPDGPAHDELRQDSWARYRPEYQRWLAHSEDGSGR